MGSSHSEVAHEFRFFRAYRDGRVEILRSQERKFLRSTTPKLGYGPRRGHLVRNRTICPNLLTRYSPSDRETAASVLHPRRRLLYAICLRYRLSQLRLHSGFPRKCHRCFCGNTGCFRSSDTRLLRGLLGSAPMVASHAKGGGREPWLINHADFDRIFIVGDSAGGTIDDEMWMYMCPTNGGLEDPRMKPTEDLARLGCERMLLFVAEKDHLRDVGWRYYEELKKSEWIGKVEIVENHGEEHCFHRRDLTYEKAVALIHRIVSFIKQS
ncbi:putative carboxylesterase 13 [Vitis vinifera]|uniref:Putative carboxylesterase 13 n=1 Tax=Vitis vinifera TaxID=29760 RepID=A0A438EPQ0_VITVI|nr:putative carboxylesterase 13 [Vitis vinifera]